MIALDPREAARAAVSAHAERPATAVLLDTPDVRLVVFRLSAGQAVPPHRSPSSVTLTVLEGTGTLSGEHDERICTAGDVVSFEPDELHGMRATNGALLLIAAITPRPATRDSARAAPAKAEQ